MSQLYTRDNTFRSKEGLSVRYPKENRTLNVIKCQKSQKTHFSSIFNLPILKNYYFDFFYQPDKK